MPIPSESDFDTLITLLQNFNAAELVDEVEQVESDFESIYTFIVRMESSLQNKLKKIEKTTVQVWLKQDPNYRKGYKKGFGTPQDDPVEDEKALKKTTDYFLNIFNNATEGKHIIHKFHADQPEVACYKMLHHRLRQSCHKLNGSWELMFCMTLRDYFYHNDTNYIEKNRQLTELLKETLRAGQSLTRFLETYQNTPTINIQNSRLLDAVSEIELELRLKTASDSIYPLSRNDATIKERLYIYRIWSWFINQSMGGMSSALVDFIHIDGIEHNLSKRTIDSHISLWTKELKNSKSSSH